MAEAIRNDKHFNSSLQSLFLSDFDFPRKFMAFKNLSLRVP